MVSLSKRTNVLIVAAVPQELQDLRFQRDPDVECLVTGMGRRAGEAVRRRLSAGGVNLVVSTGFSGGVRPGFEVGDLVMASEVIHASSGERWLPASPADDGAIPWGVGPFVTVEETLPDPAAKAETGVRFGAIAADLESAAIAQAAETAGVAWMAVRAILDPMEIPLTIRSRAQAFKLLAAPRRWREFSGFLQTVRTASRSLAGGLHCLIERRERWI